MPAPDRSLFPKPAFFISLLVVNSARGRTRLPDGDYCSTIRVVGQLLRDAMLVGGHQELTGRASPSGCGQRCRDSVTQLRVEVF